MLLNIVEEVPTRIIALIRQITVQTIKKTVTIATVNLKSYI